MSFGSLREYLDYLKAHEKIVTISRPINKDTELMPVVRCQYRGLEESERKAFLFTNVTDAKKRSYQMPVLVAALGASRAIYAAALGCRVEEINEKWNEALKRPIAPITTTNPNPPVHEVVYTGEELRKTGLDMFPIPISTPGFDVAPTITCVNWVTKDVETGIPNVGNYRAMVKAPDKLGILVVPAQHVGIHWSKQREKGGPLEAAIIIGGPPAVQMAAVAKVPYGINEYAVAGALLGRPIELVRCKTVDLEVPAEAEIILEGEITTTEKEPEAPFGEFTGFIGERSLQPFFKIKCITHRKQPIFQVYISQFPPSESSKIRGIANEAVYYGILKNECNVPFLKDVLFHETAGGQNLVVLKMKRRLLADPWQALRLAASLESGFGKIFIAVDEDIDAGDLDAVMWAIAFRAQPHRDMEIIERRVSHLDPSTAPPEAPLEEQYYPGPKGGSAILIDATRKWDYPPVSLPKKPYMDRALEIWKEEGLPELKLKEPWYGYTLGPWPAEYEEEAELAVRGEYYKTGKKLADRKVKLD
ncbi:MAG: UbiD family decarboxylase [Desulfobacterales bacterium]|nr:UbiD family decarboxylase [Desulfobacterales bacterium]